MLTTLSPGDRPFSWIIGIACVVLGMIALWRARRTDPAATVLLPYVLIMIPAALLATRTYWGLTFGPVLALFAPALLPGRKARATS